MEAAPWEDGWETSAMNVEADLAASADLFRPPPTEAWIDRQIGNKACVSPVIEIHVIEAKEIIVIDDGSSDRTVIQRMGGF